MTPEIWILAAVGYLAFLRWYFNWSGPVSSDEIEAYLADFSKGSGSQHTDVDVLRRFLEQDDGKEFVMQNFITLHPGTIPHPVTGEPANPAETLQGYTKPFIKALFKRGGHPVFMARKVGGLIDSWNAEPDANWQATAMMRYRSRRDMIELALDPRFAAIHVFKTSAVAKTISFPAQIQLSFFLRPGFYMPLVLLWLVSLLQFSL